LIEKNLLTIGILEAVEKSVGCPLCYLWAEYEARHMKNLLTDEVAMDPSFREKVRRAKGFCNYHMHLLYKTAHTPGVLDGLGYAFYMKDIVETVSESLRLLRSESFSLKPNLKNKANINILSWRQKRRQILLRLYKTVMYAVKGQHLCPACESLRSTDETRSGTLCQMLDDEDFRKDFQLSKTLCLPHFLSAVGMVRSSKLRNSADVARALLEVEKNGLHRAANYLSEFIRKQDWNARNEPRGLEANANTMALNLLVGAQGLYVVPKHDGNQMRL
jgi:hypothetical protein